MTIPFTETDDTLANLIHYAKASLDSIQSLATSEKLDSYKVSNLAGFKEDKNLFDCIEYLQSILDRLTCANILKQLKQ